MTASRVNPHQMSFLMIAAPKQVDRLAGLLHFAGVMIRAVKMVDLIAARKSAVQ